MKAAKSLCELLFQLLMNMNKLSLFIFLIFILILNTVKSQWMFHKSHENNNTGSNENINFHNKTYEEEFKFKSINTDWNNAIIKQINSNHIHNEISAANQRETKLNSANKKKQYSSEDKEQSSSEESDEKRSFSQLATLDVRKSNKTNTRIPPPSLVATDSNKSDLRVCEIKYAEYIERIFPQDSDTASDANDVEFNGRILAAPGEYPHMSALGFVSADGGMDYKCGGSLISENFVITAAHCANVTGMQPTLVRIGDLNLMVEESYLEPQIRYIKNIYVHPDYKATSFYNDMALLELERAVNFTEFVRPIRLWTKDTLPFIKAYAMGYGATSFARGRKNRLTNLNMTIVPNEQCNQEMPKLPQTIRGILSSQICARDYELNRDTWQGDSGGLLQLNIRGRRKENRIHYHLIGITSYGVYCRSRYPGVFTRVCYYLDWLERIVWKDYFKQKLKL